MSNKEKNKITEWREPIQLELLRYHKNVVTKANSFFELPYKLTLLEQKIILFMVSLVQPEDSNFLLYRFSAPELIEFLDIKTKNYGAFGEIGKMIRNLKKKTKDHL